MNPSSKITKVHKITAIILAVVAGGLVYAYAHFSQATAGITLNPTASSLEEGSKQVFSVSLDAMPLANVHVAFTATQGLVTLSTDSLDISDTLPVTFSAILPDDNVNTGDQQDTIEFTITSTDPDYDGMVIGPVTIDIIENDIPGVTTTATSDFNFVEGSSAQTVDVVLNAQPTDDVTITPQVAFGRLTISPATLVFTSSNWSTPQTVRFTVPDDLIDSGSRSESITFSATSADVNYDGISIDGFLKIIISDDDTAPVDADAYLTFNNSAITVTNDGSDTGTFTVAINDSRSSSDVTINIASTSGYTVIDPVSLLFTAGSYTVPQEVAISAVADAPESTDTLTFTKHTCVMLGKGGGESCSDEVVDQTVTVIIAAPEKKDADGGADVPADDIGDSKGDDDSGDAPSDDSGSEDSGEAPIEKLIKSNGANGKGFSKEEVAKIIAWKKANVPNYSATSVQVADTTPTKVLAKGIVANEVASVQKFLNTVLFSALPVDGKFGGRTEQAITALQKASNIKADGIVGPETASLIQKLDASEAKSANLHVGAKGDRVKILQRLLKLNGLDVADDGILGPGTWTAVVKFQQQRGLPVDGIAGPKTFLELQK